MQNTMLATARLLSHRKGVWGFVGGENEDSVDRWRNGRVKRRRSPAIRKRAGTVMTMRVPWNYMFGWLRSNKPTSGVPDQDNRWYSPPK